MYCLAVFNNKQNWVVNGVQRDSKLSKNNYLNATVCTLGMINNACGSLCNIIFKSELTVVDGIEVAVVYAETTKHITINEEFLVEYNEDLRSSKRTRGPSCQCRSPECRNRTFHTQDFNAEFVQYVHS